MMFWLFPFFKQPFGRDTDAVLWVFIPVRSDLLWQTASVLFTAPRPIRPAMTLQNQQR